MKHCPKCNAKRIGNKPFFECGTKHHQSAPQVSFQTKQCLRKQVVLLERENKMMKDQERERWESARKAFGEGVGRHGTY